MHWAKQSTATSYVIGPILDSTGAEYASAVIGDLSLSKNGATLTALASAATLTYIANGQYTLALTTGNLDTLGTARILCNKATYQMPTLALMVLPATVYDALTTNAAGASGGFHLLGTNAAAVSYTSGMTISNAGGNALTLSSSGGNGAGLATSGNGTGAGIRTTGGSTSHGIYAIGGATNGHGLFAQASTSGHGIYGAGSGSNNGMNLVGGSTGTGIYAIGGATSGPGAVFTCDTNGSGSAGLQVQGLGTMAAPDLYLVNQSANMPEVIRFGTLAGAASGTVTLDASASAVTDYYVPSIVLIVSGTGAGQCRRITAYNGSTKVATVDTAWATTPTGARFVIVPYNLGNSLTAAQIATAVWQDTTAGDFTVTGSIGKSLYTTAAPGASGGLFIAGTNAATTVTTSFTTTFTGNLTGSVGSVTGLTASNLDATVSSRSTLTQTQVTGGGYTIQSSSCVLGDARIANLNATVTSRLASGAGLIALDTDYGNSVLNATLQGDINGDLQGKVIASTGSTIFGPGVWAYNAAGAAIAPAATALSTVQWTNARAANLDNLATAPLTTLGSTAPAGWINTAAFAAGTTVPRVTLADTATTVTGLATDAVSAASVSAAAGAKMADITLRRLMSNVEASANGDTISLSSLYGIVQQIQKSSASGTTLTVKKTDGTTTLGTKTLTTNAAADPVTGVS